MDKEQYTEYLVISDTTYEIIISTNNKETALLLQKQILQANGQCSVFERIA